MGALFVLCKACGKEFQTQLQADPSELTLDRPFNSMEICPHCRRINFYVRDDFHATPQGTDSP